MTEWEGRLTVGFGDEERVDADLMLVAVGRGPLVSGIGLEAAGVAFDSRKGIETDDHRRTSVPHIYAVGDCAGYWQLAHTAFREGEIAAENACGHESVIGEPAVPRPIYTDPEIASVGLTEEQARERHGEDVAVGVFPWIANARAVMQNDTTGFVKSIHETRYGELLGLVIVGPHATDLIEAGVVALDAESTVETVADGIAPHPTLSEAIKEAGLVALGRAIHLPNRKPRARPHLSSQPGPEVGQPRRGGHESRAAEGAPRRARRQRAAVVASQRSTARAHWRPSLIAQTISDWPRRASPAAKTPSTELA